MFMVVRIWYSFCVRTIQHYDTERHTTMNLQDCSKAELLAIIETLSTDLSFGIMKKERGILEYGNIADNTPVIFIDLANVHAANHLYTMDGYDSFVRNVTSAIKHEDVVIKFGGDEVVILPRTGTHIAEYIARLTTLLHTNNIYAVIASAPSINGLVETVKYLDAIVSDVKLELELTGKKPSRDEAYHVMESVVVISEY